MDEIGPYDFEIRLEALTAASRAEGSPGQIVDRAMKYEAYLRGGDSALKIEEGEGFVEEPPLPEPMSNAEARRRTALVEHASRARTRNMDYGKDDSY